ncbi:MAG: hypothetical protein IT457_24680 [Planctomycetes bacterium]|nr:hypothetical protein [Planctomycetota bacterium]
MDVRLLYPSEYVAAADLIEAQKKTGRDGVTLTISAVEIEDLKTNRGTEKKPVVRFREYEGRNPSKRLVMNKTNARLIAKLYGHETSNWIGKRITLWPTQCECFGETVDCVRVMPHVPQGSPRDTEQAPAAQQAPRTARPRQAAPAQSPQQTAMQAQAGPRAQAKPLALHPPAAAEAEAQATLQEVLEEQGPDPWDREELPEDPPPAVVQSAPPAARAAAPTPARQVKRWS